jgi:hypothetical protein
VIDSIEIERMMIEGARRFSPRNDRAYQDPRSRIHIEDAKTFFAAHGRKYDVIVSEPSNPWVSGTSTLFSEEFYAHTRRYLADDGLLVQWVQGYEIDPELLSTIFNALGKHYGDYTVFHNLVDLIVVATPGRTLPPMRDDLFSFPGMAAEMAHLGYRNLRDLQALRVAGRATLEPLWRRIAYPANSDYFPILDQRAPRARFEKRSAVTFVKMRETLAPGIALLDGDTRLGLDALGKPGFNWTVRADRAYFGAETLGVVIGGVTDAAVSIDSGARAAATLVHRLAADCRGARVEWVNAVTTVARVAVPYVDRADVEPLFETVRGSACLKIQDELGRRRLALLEAINALDAAAVSEHATWALLRLPPQLESERAFLVISALSGAVAARDWAHARALAQSHVPRLPPTERDGPLVQLLLGHLDRAPR